MSYDELEAKLSGVAGPRDDLLGSQPDPLLQDAGKCTHAACAQDKKDDEAARCVSCRKFQVCGFDMAGMEEIGAHLHCLHCLNCGVGLALDQLHFIPNCAISCLGLSLACGFP